eukprot:gb/GECG01007087.1/.p1 GENE.gb/GECG01007087.1/~~gb/GECG01007087.1/.p1  ORF type:complete len:549 (+),score=118.54 gb/GECG01007087.1/:1-1647(+)
MASFDHVLNRCKQWILDEQRVLTSFWLAHALQISARDAKQVLAAFVHCQQPKHPLLAYLLPPDDRNYVWDYVEQAPKSVSEMKKQCEGKTSSASLCLQVQTLIISNSSSKDGSTKIQLAFQDKIADHERDLKNGSVDVEIYAIQAVKNSNSTPLSNAALYNTDVEQAKDLSTKEGTLGAHFRLNKAGSVRMNEEFLKVGTTNNDYQFNQGPALPVSSGTVKSKSGDNSLNKSERKSAVPKVNERVDNSQKAKKTVNASSFFTKANKSSKQGVGTPKSSTEDAPTNETKQQPAARTTRPKASDSGDVAADGISSAEQQAAKTTSRKASDSEDAAADGKYARPTQDHDDAGTTEDDKELFDDEDSDEDVRVPGQNGNVPQTSHQTKSMAQRKRKSPEREQKEDLQDKVSETGKKRQSKQGEAGKKKATQNTQQKKKATPTFHADDGVGSEENEAPTGNHYFGKFGNDSSNKNEESQRKRRKKLVEKTYEEDGYLVTKKVMEEVSDEECEMEEPVKKEPAKATPSRQEPKPVAKSRTDKKQSSMMNFFKKP